MTTPPERPTGDPRWISQAVDLFLEELALWARTAAGFARHPMQFARDWSAGTGRAQNPLGFLATSAAVLGTAQHLLTRALNRPEPDLTLLQEVENALSPYAYYATLGLVAHLALRILGSRRRYSSSIALALFAGGGPALFASFVSFALLLVIRPTGPSMTKGLSTPAMLVALTFVYGSFIVFVGTLTAALAALHGRNLLVCAVVVGLAVIGVGALLGAYPVSIATVHFVLRQGVPDLYF